MAWTISSPSEPEGLTYYPKLNLESRFGERSLYGISKSFASIPKQLLNHSFFFWNNSIRLSYQFSDQSFLQSSSNRFPLRENLLYVKLIWPLPYLKTKNIIFSSNILNHQTTISI